MIQSVNFRLGDALPADVLERWKMELGGKPPDDIYQQIYRRAEIYLDAGHGECWLRQPTIARVVEDALLHFDGERYRLLAWNVMPNHVHALIETRGGFPLSEILHAWKSYSAKAANKILKRQGEFWQRDYFDRFIRNAEHFAAAIAYIEENPVKAGLARVKTDWRWSSARVRQAATGTGTAGFQPAS